MSYGDVAVVDSSGFGLEPISPSDAGKVLTSNGVGSLPTFQTPSASAVDYVVASDGATPTPSPLNDGFGNFIYVSYTP